MYGAKIRYVVVDWVEGFDIFYEWKIMNSCKTFKNGTSSIKGTRHYALELSILMILRNINWTPKEGELGHYLF